MSDTSATGEPVEPLKVKVKPPEATRMRVGVVRGGAIAAGLLVAGALAWTFVVEPELRHHRRQAGEADAAPVAEVRPSEAVTDQPTSYDRLPEPRFIRATEDETDAEGAAASAAAPPRASVRPRPRQGAAIRTDAQALAVRSGLFFEDAAPAAAGRSDAERSAPGWNENRLQPPRSPYEVKAGTVLPALMLTAVDTARPGTVVGVVSRPVFDTVSGRHLLIPAGARLIGRHEGDGRHGEGRAYLVWDRIVLPNGKSLALEGEPGVDAGGAVGVEGRVRRRSGAMLFAALLGGAVTALGQAARDDDRGGWLGDAGDAAAIEAAQVGGRLIDRELQVRPSVQLSAGTPVRVLITRDLVLEPFAS
jgi:type IV secretory pathway VirB10-like protein